MGKRQPDGGRQDVAYFCPSILIRPPLMGGGGLKEEGSGPILLSPNPNLSAGVFAAR